MKIKTLIAVAVAFGAFTLTSCKKERTCTCTMDGEEVSKVTYPKNKEEVQKQACDAGNSSAGGVTVTCTLSE